METALVYTRAYSLQPAYVFLKPQTPPDNGGMGKTATAKAIELLVRLRKPHLLKKDGSVNQAQLGTEAKLEQPTIQRILSGESKRAAPQTVEVLATFFNASIGQVTGLEDIETPGESGIPIVGNTQGGPDHQWVEMGYPPGYGDESVNMVSKDSNAYALYVRGSSMSPRFREGDVIVVEPSMAAEPGDDVVVRTTDGQVMIKTLTSNRNDQVILSSIAQDHDRIVLPFSKIEFIHPVGATVPPRSIFKRKFV